MSAATSNVHCVSLPRPRLRAPECKHEGGGGSFCRTLLLRCGIGIDHRAGLVLRRPQDRLHAAVAELIEIARRDILELREQRARLRPGAVASVSDVADDGVEGVLVHVIGELYVIETLVPSTACANTCPAE